MQFHQPLLTTAAAQIAIHDFPISISVGSDDTRTVPKDFCSSMSRASCKGMTPVTSPLPAYAIRA
jgi:hypothetical protein